MAGPVRNLKELMHSDPNVQLMLRLTEYGVRWVDKLEALAAAWPGWRSEKERSHVFAQFEEARAIYRGFGREAR